MGLAEQVLASRKPRHLERLWPVGAGSVPGMDGRWGHDQSQFSPAEYLEYVATSNEVFSAAMLRARLMSSLHLRLYRGDDADKKALPNHPASTLLGYINPFWCVDEETEALTARGWVTGAELTTNDILLSMDPADGRLKWSAVTAINRQHYAGPMHRIQCGPMDALVTPGHKFPLLDGRMVRVEDLRQGDVIRAMGSAVQDDIAGFYSDAFVELVGWAVTEGHYVRTRHRTGRQGEQPIYGDYRPTPTTVTISQKSGTDRCARIKAVLKEAGARWHESTAGPTREIRAFGVTGETAKAILAVAPDRVMVPEFILTLTARQRELLIDTMVSGDGWRNGRSRYFCQKDERSVDAFLMLCAISGYPASAKLRTWKGNHHGGPIWVVGIRQDKTVRPRRRVPADTSYEGMVWCPQTEFGTFVCRRGGRVFVTGNTARRLARMDELCMCLLGQTFWAVEGGRDGRPSEIWWMKPSQVRPVPHETGYLQGYLYEPQFGAPSVRFEPHEVIWFRYPNPIDEFAALSPLAAARLAADAAAAMMKSNEKMFRQGLQIAGLITPPADKVTFSTAQADELSDQLERRFAGADKAHRWAVLRYEAQFKQLQMSPKDAEFATGLQMTLRQVCNAYGIPAPLLNDPTGATLANMSEHTKALWAHTLVPDSQLRAAEIVEQYLPLFPGRGGPDHAEYDYSSVPALQESHSETWSRDAQALDRGAITINEWRRRNGLPDVEWGDEPWLPMNKAQYIDGELKLPERAAIEAPPGQETADGGPAEVPDDEVNPANQPAQSTGATVDRTFDHHAARRLIADAFGDQPRVNGYAHSR